LTLYLFGAQFSLYAFVGLFMLMGIVMKNGIMMVDFAIQRQAEGRTPLDAVVEACQERLRPILMTTLAAVFGALPMALALGSDGSSRQPLGLVIVGGLLVAQFLTLFVTPAIYLYFEAFQDKVLDRVPLFARGAAATEGKKATVAG
jgi:HAE1 family hydrophobic/amphiphilic exporter-1